MRQRLALGAVSPALIQAYRDGELTLAQVEAFTVTDDHDRQDQAFQGLGVYRDPYRIREMLTQAHVSDRDRRIVFLGLDTYEAAGGAVLRDLFRAAYSALPTGGHGTNVRISGAEMYGASDPTV